jgi:hypothetical protein
MTIYGKITMPEKCAKLADLVHYVLWDGPWPLSPTNTSS